MMHSLHYDVLIFKYFVLRACTKTAFAGEVPVLLQIFISSLSVIHDIDIADEGILCYVSDGDVFDGNYVNLSPSKP